MPEIFADEFASQVSASPQIIRRHCGNGMTGARRDPETNRWIIDPEAARPWLLEHAPKIAKRMPIGMSPPLGSSQPPPEPSPTQSNLQTAPQIITIPLTEQPSPPLTLPPVPPALPGADPLTTHIAMLQQLMGVTLELMGGGELSGQASTLFKQLSSECRQLMQLQREEKKADAQLMERDHHRIVVETMAKLIVQEGDSVKSILPGVVAAALSKAGIEFADPKRALNIIRDAGAQAWESALGRMALHIREAMRARRVDDPPAPVEQQEQPARSVG